MLDACGIGFRRRQPSRLLVEQACLAQQLGLGCASTFQVLSLWSMAQGAPWMTGKPLTLYAHFFCRTGNLGELLTLTCPCQSAEMRPTSTSTTGSKDESVFWCLTCQG